ncbi:MAG: zinc finger domain protein [Myxococcaceae bacterium]|nr:zinc finger domain protein [Myxococcaceae bacterium]
MPRRWGSRSNGRYGSMWPAYVPVAERRQQADKDVAALRKKGRAISPVVIEGRKRAIAMTFWGKAWCDHLESYSDYENRLPRGRTYVRNGSVVHLDITGGKVEALVRGSSMYTVKLEVKALASLRWKAVARECSGQVTSLVELLQGKLSHGVMEIVTDRARGIFPSPAEISLSCTCPDWATMCKHVAAAMYGVGARLDARPELLFLLRGVDPAELIAKSVGRAAAKASRGGHRTLADDALGSIFGIDIDEGAAATPRAKAPPAAKGPSRVPTSRTRRASR